MSERGLLAVILAIILAGCGNSEKARLANPNISYLPSSGSFGSEAPGAPVDNISYWDGDGIQGPASVIIYLNEQRAYFYKGEQLVGVSQVSAGREGYDTPPGTYKVIQKDKDHVSNLYGDFVDAAGNVVQENVSIKDPKPPGSVFRGAPMPFFMRITGGVGMHKGYLPGYPASHGCIRMPGKMAETFFDNVQVGTPVTVMK